MASLRGLGSDCAATRKISQRQIESLLMADEAQVNELITADCYPVTAMPGLNRLFLDFCAGTLPDFLPSPGKWQEQPPVAGHRQELVRLLALQNPQASTAPALAALASGAGTVL